MESRPGVKHHTITDIVSAVYCEQKMIFDRDRGRNESRDARLKREDGIRQHKRFESSAIKKKDSRCFIVTAVYGGDAVETEFLRDWRDRSLMQSAVGRGLVRAYYTTSPLLLPVLRRSGRLTALARGLLDRVVRFLEGR